MTKAQKIILIISVCLGVTIVGGALIIAINRDSKQPRATAERSVSRTELSQADGHGGRDCYVAVDGVAYQIKDFSLWQNGQHASSNGLAYCGADLSKVIDQSPHGRKMLDLLIKLGPLK